jgi:hypothetical protein
LKTNHSPCLLLSLFLFFLFFLFAIAGCDSPSNAEPCETGLCLDAGSPLSTCDPGLMCAMVNTCVEGLLYPTSCGPNNCDDAIGPCVAATDSGMDAAMSPPPHDAAVPHDAHSDAPHDARAEGSNLDARPSGDL